MRAETRAALVRPFRSHTVGGTDALFVLRRSVWLELATGGAAAALAAGLSVWALQLWRANLHVPFAYSGDVNFYLMLTKGTIENPWPYVNHHLGVPFGQQLYDFALGGEHLDLLFLEGLRLFTRDAALALNVLYLLSFPLSAVAAYAVLRWARVTRLVAGVCAVLYALAPYHFARGEREIFLSLDFAVPLGAYLILATLSGRELFERRLDVRGAHAWITKRSLLTVGACFAVVSTGEFYYGGFALILVALALLARLVAGTTSRARWSGVAVLVTLICAGLVDLSPTIAYYVNHGANHIAAVRSPADSDVYGLRLVQLLEPVPNHRIAALASFTRFYNWSAARRTAVGSEQPALGMFASIGFVWLFVVLVASIVGFKRALPDWIERSRQLAVAAWSAFLVGTVGGFGTLVAYVLTPQLRAWNRISIFIAFFGILASATLLDSLRRRLAGTLRRILFVAALGAIGTFAVLDQTTPADVPAYRSVAMLFHSDDGFVRAIEQRLPRNSMIFELPYVPFPEGLTTGRTNGYDAVRPYLHSHSLRWSYGAMKGRPGDWSPYIVDKPLPEVVAGVAAAGFNGIVVDRNAYIGTPARPWRTLHRLLGERPLASPEGRFVFFDLLPYRARLRAHFSASELAALTRATLRPPRALAGRGMLPGEETNARGDRSMWVTADDAELDLYQPGAPGVLVFHAELLSRHAPSQLRVPTKVTLRWPGGKTSRVVVAARGSAIARRFKLHHGNNFVAIQVRGPSIYAPWDSHTLRLQILDARFDEPAFAPFAPRPKKRHEERHRSRRSVRRAHRHA